MNATPMTKYGPGKSAEGEALLGDRARTAKRDIAIVNSMAQDRPDLAVTAGLLS